MVKRTSKSIKKNSTRAEAAQYALLCRVSPALRHRLVGKLHPIGLTAAVADRQLRADKLDIANARDSIAKVQLQTREAIASAIGTLAWLTAEETASVTLKEGVDLCVDLIRADCEMQGVTITSSITDVSLTVTQRALRIVLTASLIALIDTMPNLSRIELRSTATDGKTVDIHFDLHSADAIHTALREQRLLSWDDVQALADVEGAKVFRSGTPPLIKCRFGAVIPEIRSDAGANSPVQHA